MSSKIVKRIMGLSLNTFVFHFKRMTDSKKLKPRIIQAGPGQGLKLMLTNREAQSYQKMLTGTYEPCIYQELSKIIDLSGKNIWDLGAHFGYHALVLAKLSKTGQILAIEANPRNADILKMNIKENQELAARLQVKEIAISDQEEEIEFNVSRFNFDPSSLGGYLCNVAPPIDEHAYRNFKKIKVKTTTMDKLLLSGSPRPDIIKIDVEGAEAKVLQGGLEVIKVCQPILIIEIHTILMMNRVTKLLNQLNYGFKIIDPDNPMSTKNIIATPRI